MNLFKTIARQQEANKRGLSLIGQALRVSLHEPTNRQVVSRLIRASNRYRRVAGGDPAFGKTEVRHNTRSPDSEPRNAG